MIFPSQACLGAHLIISTPGLHLHDAIECQQRRQDLGIYSQAHPATGYKHMQLTYATLTQHMAAAGGLCHHNNQLLCPAVSR